MRTQSGQLRRRDRALGCQVVVINPPPQLYFNSHTCVWRISSLTSSKVFKKCLRSMQWSHISTMSQKNCPDNAIFDIVLSTPPTESLHIIMAPLEFCRVVRQEGGREEPIRALAGDKYGPTANGHQLYKECTLFVPLRTNQHFDDAQSTSPILIGRI